MALTSTNTNSTLLSPTGLNATSTGLSTNIIIKVNGQTVGAIQNLDYTEARSVKMINEIGADGNIDSAPQASTKISGSCNRIRFDGMRIATAFSRGFIHVSAQRKPFDILIIDNWSGEGSLAVNTTIKNVWITNIGTKYAADNFIITDSMSWEAETIYSQVASGQASVQGGVRKFPLQIDSIEQEADIGKRRGGMDSAGLLLSFGF